MPISVRRLAMGPRTMSIPFDEDNLTLTYDADKINAEREQQELDLRTRGYVIKGIAYALSEIIVSWDLQQDDGQPYPIDQAALERLGLPTLRLIRDAIQEDYIPNLGQRVR